MANISDIKLWREIKCFLQKSLGIEDIIAGDNITIDKTNPKKPIISSMGGGGTGTIQSIQPGSDNVIINSSDPKNPSISVEDNGVQSVNQGTGVIVDNTDPKNPIISSSGGSIEAVVHTFTLSNIEDALGIEITGDETEEELDDLIADYINSLGIIIQSGELHQFILLDSGGDVFEGIVTEDSDTVSFTGTGTSLDPLSAEATGEVIIPGTTAQYWRGDKTWQTLDKVAVGLPNVDNTSDLNKPVSTAQQTAINNKAPKPFVYTPTGNFNLSSVKTALEATGILFNDSHIIIELGANNYTMTLDIGATNPNNLFTFERNGTGLLTITSTRTLDAALGLLVLAGKQNSMGIVQFKSTTDYLSISNK